MDFNYSEAQDAVRALAERIFSERSTHERLKEIELAGPARVLSTAPFGRSWRRPAFSAYISARTMAAAVSISSPHAS